MKRFLAILLLFISLQVGRAQDSIRQTWPSAYDVVTTTAEVHYTIHFTTSTPGGTYYIGYNWPGTTWIFYGISWGGGAGTISGTTTWAAADNQVTQGVTTTSTNHMLANHIEGPGQSGGATGVLYVSGGRDLIGISETGSNSTSPTALPNNVIALSYTVDTHPIALHPQLLTASGTNAGTKSENWGVINAAGTAVLTWGIGPHLSGTAVWTPPDSSYDGTYSMGAYDAFGTFHLMATATLSPSTSGTYSDTWSNPNPSGSYGVASSGTNGLVTNNSGHDVAYQWISSTGAILGSGTITNGSSTALNTPTETLPSGSLDTVTLKNTTDGTTLGTVNLFNTGDGGTQSNGSITVTLNPAAGATAPTGAQTNTGNTPTGVTSPNTTPTTQVNNSTTSVSGGTNGVTNQDIYNDVKQAITDADQSPITAPTIAMPSVATWPDTTTASNNATTIENKVSTDLASSGTSSLSPVPVAPTISGSQTSLAIPAIGILPAMTVDWSSYGSSISIFRTLCLVAVNLTYVFALYRVAASTTT